MDALYVGLSNDFKARTFVCLTNSACGTSPITVVNILVVTKTSATQLQFMAARSPTIYLSLYTFMYREHANNFVTNAFLIFLYYIVYIILQYYMHFFLSNYPILFILFIKSMHA